MRPLGISIYEDKIVQLALKKILEAICEPKFKDNMVGFRPNRGCHQAIKYVRNKITKDKISYIVDAAIKRFFDHINHEDDITQYQRYKYIMDNGNFIETTEGSAQGNMVSPVLANIYMHYALILMLYNFRQRTIEMLFKVLNKRSNRRSYNWDGLNEMFKVYKIETPKIYVSLFE